MNYNYRVHKIILPLVMTIALFVSGCGLNLSMPNAVTPTPFIITSTLPPTIPPPITDTPPPPALLPTAAPIEGTTSTQLNVRGEPSTAGVPLGLISAFAKVQIIGKDSSGNWYQILYTAAPDGKGWVTAQYVQVKDKEAIPVIGGASGSGSGPSGVVTQQVNVRSGPGTDSRALGTLNPNDVITLTGKDANGAWLQIRYAGAPDGKGWIAAAYVQTSGAEDLPIISPSGEVVGTGTPTTVPPTITPTLVAAPQDGDSAQSPAVNITFSPSGTGSLIYSSDVSAPQGDQEDWIQFTPYNPVVTMALACTGNGTLKVELWQNGSLLQNWGSLACSGTRQLSLSSGQPYLLRLYVVPANSGLEYIRYTLSLRAIP